MKKKTLFLIPLLLGAVGGAQADEVFQFTMNTAAINGDSGSLDFSLSPGAGSDQSLTATVYDFSTDTGSYAGFQELDGNAFGGPVTLDSPLASGPNVVIGPVPDAYGLNDDFETFNYGNTLSFLVDISGPALTAPDGEATSGYEFDFETFSDPNGIDPVLTDDPNGISGSIDVSPDGVVTYNDVSSAIGIAPAVPEPASVWLFAGALGAAFLFRRRVAAFRSR